MPITKMQPGDEKKWLRLRKQSTIYVLAENHRQADEWARRRVLLPSEYHYIKSSKDLYGTRGIKFVRIGTWSGRADLPEILTMLHAVGAKEVTDDPDFENRAWTNTIFAPRPHTQDSFIINEVYHENCYRLPDGPDSLSGITLIDIGANIGAFTAACVERGAERVIAFEPDRDNYDQLVNAFFRNKWLNRVAHFEAAVVGNSHGRRYTYLSHSCQLNGVRLTGGFSLVKSGKIPVPLFSIDQVMQMVNPLASQIWVKLDCEGSEHNIAPYLADQRIKRVFGEVHTTVNGRVSRDTEKVDYTLPTHEVFAGVLESIGFRVEMVQNEDDECLALFWAERT